VNILDYIILGIMGILGLRCLFRGLISEVLSAAAMVGGLLAGVVFHRPVGAWLAGMVNIGSFSVIAGFLLSFAVVFIVVKIIERSLRTVFENLQLEALDRVLGLLFGLVEGLILSTIILLILRYQPIFDVAALLEGSFFARLLLPLLAEHLPAAELS
jgi:membrane protein required for colicin V production